MKRAGSNAGSFFLSTNIGNKFHRQLQTKFSIFHISSPIRCGMISGSTYVDSTVLLVCTKNSADPVRCGSDSRMFGTYNMYIGVYNLSTKFSVVYRNSDRRDRIGFGSIKIYVEKSFTSLIKYVII